MVLKKVRSRHLVTDISHRYPNAEAKMLSHTSGVSKEIKVDLGSTYRNRYEGTRNLGALRTPTSSWTQLKQTASESKEWRILLILSSAEKSPTSRMEMSANQNGTIDQSGVGI